MRSFFLFLFITLVSATLVTAQFKRPHLLLGGNISYFNPQGSFKNDYNLGVGGELIAGVGFHKTYITGSWGTNLFLANSKNNDGNLNYKPVKFGVKQYLLLNKLFVAADAGVASVKDKSMISAENKFATGVGAGVHFLGLEAGIYYDAWKAVHEDGMTNTLQLKVGINKIL